MNSEHRRVKLKMLYPLTLLTYNNIKSFDTCNCTITADLSAIYLERMDLSRYAARGICPIVIAFPMFA